MSDKEWRNENDLKVDFIIKEVTNGDENASAYLYDLSAAARIVDDIYDEFENVNSGHAMLMVEILFVRIPSNPFFQTYRKELETYHFAMWQAWEASNALENGDETDRIYHHVLRDYCNEILLFVALKCLGYNQVKEVNLLIRSLFNKKLGE